MASSVLDLCRVSIRGTPGAVTEFAPVPRLDGDRMVAATTEAVGRRLRVVVWRVDQPTGKITRLGDSERQAGTATSIDIAKGTP